MYTKLEKSRIIWDQATKKYPPYAVLIAMSGGGDSMAAYYASKALNIPIDGIIHVCTRTGIFRTTEFVRWFAEQEKVKYFEGDAGDTYEQRVLNKGFFGVGMRAHSFAYHLLKKAPLEKTISHNIRLGKRHRPVLIINGARLSESENRRKNYASSAIRASGNNIWVNLLQYWSKTDCEAICHENKAPCNPVSRELCRSGECMCGTMQSQQERLEAASLFPEWGTWLDTLEKRAKEIHPWGWGVPIPQSWQREKQGQLSLFSSPMCSDCTSKAEKLKTLS